MPLISQYIAFVEKVNFLCLSGSCNSFTPQPIVHVLIVHLYNSANNSTFYVNIIKIRLFDWQISITWYWIEIPISLPWNGTCGKCHLSPQENIFTIAVVNIRYSYTINSALQHSKYISYTINSALQHSFTPQQIMHSFTPQPIVCCWKLCDNTAYRFLWQVLACLNNSHLWEFDLESWHPPPLPKSRQWMCFMDHRAEWLAGL